MELYKLHYKLVVRIFTCCQITSLSPEVTITAAVRSVSIGKKKAGLKLPFGTNIMNLHHKLPKPKCILFFICITDVWLTLVLIYVDQDRN